MYYLACLIDLMLWDAIQERFTARDDNIHDVFDGENYRKLLVLGGFLSYDNPANISLLMNTDDVAIFHSSTTSLWPIWVVINELPPSLR